VIATRGIISRHHEDAVDRFLLEADDGWKAEAGKNLDIEDFFDAFFELQEGHNLTASPAPLTVETFASITVTEMSAFSFRSPYNFLRKAHLESKSATNARNSACFETYFSCKAGRDV
jgi:hypothetical protein